MPVFHTIHTLGYRWSEARNNPGRLTAPPLLAGADYRPRSGCVADGPWPAPAVDGPFIEGDRALPLHSLQLG